MVLRTLVGITALASTILAFFDEPGSKVALLTDNEWEDFSGQNSKFLAMFFAPWCGHCKTMKPAYSEAAEELQFRAPLVAMDCTEQKVVCGKYEVTGFPTLKWFQDGEAQEYNGGREAQAFINFVNEKVGDEPDNFDNLDFSKMKIKELKKILHSRGVSTAGLSEKNEFVQLVKDNVHLPKKAAGPKKGKKSNVKSSLVNGRTVVQERRYKAAVAAAEEGFGADNGEVVHLTEDTWAETVKVNPKMFVTFWAPWCGHCRELKPELVEASNTCKETDPDVKFAAVECVTNAELCNKMGAKSFPTIKYLTEENPKGQMFSGGRDANGISKWISKTNRPDEWVPEAFVNDMNKWEENGVVVHLTDDHWDQYRTENPKLLAVFYAPWCGHCKSLKPDYAAASTELEEMMPLVAVDCTVETATCAKYGVQGFPSIKYFDSSDSEGEDYSSGRDKDAFVAFVQEKAGSTYSNSDIHEEL